MFNNLETVRETRLYWERRAATMEKLGKVNKAKKYLNIALTLYEVEKELTNG